MKKKETATTRKQPQLSVIVNEHPEHEPDRKFKRFYLKRKQDISGVSGTGYVAEGCQFSDGTCCIKWTTETSSMGIYHSHVEMIYIHGHGGSTEIEWVDE